MRIVRDGIQLCPDCMIAAVNGDTSGIESAELIAAIDAGLQRLGPHLVPSFDSESGEGYDEFMARRCECCRLCNAGPRYEFSVLGEDHVRPTPALAKKASAARVGDTIRHRGCEYRVIACDGAAHSNAFIDNCGDCAPLWGKRLVR